MNTRLVIGLLVVVLVLPVGISSAQQNDNPAGCTIELETLILELVQAQRAADTGNTFQAVQTLDAMQAHIADLVERCEGVLFPLPQTYTAPDDTIAFDYPADWKIANPDTGLYLLTSSSALAGEILDNGLEGLESGQQALILGVMRQGEEIGESVTYKEYVETFVKNEIDSMNARVLGPVPLEVAGHSAQRYTVNDENIAAIFDLADFTDAEQSAILVVAGVAAPNELELLEPILDAFEKHIRYPAQQNLRIPGVTLDALSYSDAILLRDIIPGLQSTTTLAPDGSAIAWYDRGASGAICLFILDEAQTACSPVPEQWSVPVTQIVWSPDAAYIAWTGDFFRYFKESDIMLYEVATGQISNATDDGIEDWDLIGGTDETGPLWVDTTPTWGPDGYLYFIRDELESAQDDRDMMRTGLYRLNPTDQQVERVRDLTEYFVNWVIYPIAQHGLEGSMALSPDASQIAFLVRYPHLDDPQNGVYVMNLTGDEPPTHVTTTDQLQVGYPNLGNDQRPPIPIALAWTPGGDKLIVWSGYFNFEYGYTLPHVIDLASQRVTPLLDFSGMAREDLNKVDETSGKPPIYYIPHALVLAPDGESLLMLHYWDGQIGLSALEWVDGQDRVEQTVLFESDEALGLRGWETSSAAARDGTLLLSGILFLPNN